jgi:cell division protein ZapE
MDIFYNAVPIRHKERIHYHSFMLQIHTELFKLHSYENPLEELAKNIIKNKKVLCIDEFFIDNIADAMIMKTLLTRILTTNNILIITTNIPPQKLYENGLQRQHFIDVITYIEKYLKIINLDGDLDYRCTKLKKQDLYLTTQDKKSMLKCRKLYTESSPENVKTIRSYIEVDKHKINTVRISENAIWFNFKEICTTPRSKDDYVKISNNYPVVIITNIPPFKDNNISSLRRFITFVDELYEKKTKIIILTEETIDNLHNTEQLSFEFKRTLSRLTEMQSTEYNNTKHKGN